MASKRHGSDAWPELAGRGENHRHPRWPNTQGLITRQRNQYGGLLERLPLRLDGEPTDRNCLGGCKAHRACSELRNRPEAPRTRMPDTERSQPAWMIFMAFSSRPRVRSLASARRVPRALSSAQGTEVGRVDPLFEDNAVGQRSTPRVSLLARRPEAPGPYRAQDVIDA